MRIETNNAAFEEDPERELAALLRAVAKKIEALAATAGAVLDSNGNKVGWWEIIP
jgi:hypothetical protein